MGTAKYSRKRATRTRKTATRSKRKPKTTVKRLIDRALNRNIETKTSVFSATDGIQIAHNNFQSCTTALLATTQGVGDPDTSPTVGQRVGDRINLKGVSLRLMLELNERYADVTFRVMVIKAARNDTPTRASMFMGQSGNKMLDKFNHERYTIIAQEWVQIKTAGLTGIGPEAAVGEGNNNANSAGYMFTSRATKIVRMWIPGVKFHKTGVIQYENGGTQAKFFDYHVQVYAYSNWSTYQDVYNVGRINDYIHEMHYKDA